MKQAATTQDHAPLKEAIRRSVSGKSVQPQQVDPSTATDPEWVSDKYLADYFQVSRQSIWRWSRKGVIPEPKRIGINVTRWRLNDVLAALGCATTH